MVERIDVSPEYVESERVGRYKDLKLSNRAFVDALIPGRSSIKRRTFPPSIILLNFGNAI